MELRERLQGWLWRRKWSTVSVDRISEIISDTAPKYGVKYVAFRSDSPDGIVRPKDTLDIYVVNNGGMSYFDLAKFSGEVMTAMNRDAFFHPMGSRTAKSDLEGLGATIAYEESPVSEGPRAVKIRETDIAAAAVLSYGLLVFSMMDAEDIELCIAEPQGSDSDGSESITVFMQDYLIHDELRERDVWEDITYFMGYIRTYDPVEEEERAKMKAETITEYLTERYATFHDIPEQQAADILNGCGALDGFYESDMVTIGHMNMCKLTTWMRNMVERLGGTNPPAIYPKQMEFETVTGPFPYPI